MKVLTSGEIEHASGDLAQAPAFLLGFRDQLMQPWLEIVQGVHLTQLQRKVVERVADLVSKRGGQPSQHGLPLQVLNFGLSGLADSQVADDQQHLPLPPHIQRRDRDGAQEGWESLAVPPIKG